MGPRIGKLAFTMGLIILLLGILVLPFLPLTSGEFVVDVMAICTISIFLLLLTWYIRRQSKKSDEKSNNSKG